MSVSIGGKQNKNASLQAKVKNNLKQRILFFLQFITMALSKQGDDDVIREMTSAKSVKEDAALLLAPYMNFEEFLVPAPISICVLGEFVFPTYSNLKAGMCSFSWNFAKF